VRGKEVPMAHQGRGRADPPQEEKGGRKKRMYGRYKGCVRGRWGGEREAKLKGAWEGTVSPTKGKRKGIGVGSGGERTSNGFWGEKRETGCERF